jgi:hypothetical protein
MTSYHGGKQKFGKEIAYEIFLNSLDILEKQNNIEIKGYCEPFCGMMGVYQHIHDIFDNKIKYKAGDLNESVILLWKKLKNGWKPPKKISENEYNEIKNSRNSALKGYVGHQYSFGGKYFKGYAPKYGKIFDSEKVIDKLSIMGKKFKDVEYKYGDYTQYSNLKNYIIYCDPPYSNTESHYTSSFDSEKFYDWCIKMSKNNIVFVSEYKNPRNFNLILSIKNKLTGISPSQKKSKRKSKKREEKLYIVN